MTHSRPRIWLAGASLALLLVIVSGCLEKPKQQESKISERSQARRARAAARVADDGSRIKIEECVEFADRFQRLIAGRFESEIQALLDWESIIDRATDGWELPPDIRRELATGAASNSAWAQRIVQWASGTDGELYEFLRVHGDSKSPGLWFRLLTSEGGFVYHDYRLGRNRHGQLRIVDIYKSGTGEELSATLRPYLVSLIEEEQRGILDRLSGPTNPVVEHCREIDSVFEIYEQNPEAALRICKQLPEEVRAMKIISMLQAEVAAQVSEEEYSVALAELIRFHGQDEKMQSVLLNNHVAKENWEAALTCTDKIDAMVGGDSYLQTMRATIFLKMGRLADARQAADAAVEDRPYLLRCVLADVEVSLAECDFQRVLSLLLLVEEEFEVEFHDVTTIPGYEGFVASPYYQEWLDCHRTAQAPADGPAYEKWPREVY